MSENKIELKSVSELLGMNFFIPSYQRGYRWTEQQVKDLMNDIWEFSLKENKRNGEFYCLQPLVVKSKDEDVLTQIKTANTIEQVKKLLKGSWEVIDGQQRLTTIFILLSFLNSGGDKLYTLSYETRKDFDEFEEFLNKCVDDDVCIANNIEEVDAQFKNIVDREKKKNWDNIDFYHIFVAYISINKWFGNDEEKKSKFKDALLNKVEFIWYETDEVAPVKVFTRLNIGKISLTNAELIKALFLNRSNFSNEFDDHLRLRQQEISSEWDSIEYTLQNDEFWLFLHENGYDRPTRIDFIFDLICEQNALHLLEDLLKSIGTDEYKTFRYFYEYFKQGKTDKSKIETCWAEVKKYFQTFQEWFNNLELYHYVGVLLSDDFIGKVSIYDYYNRWNGDKKEFVDYLKKEIANAISVPQGKFLCNPEHIEESLHFDSDKKLIRKILLVHNVQTIVIQNRCVKANDKYKLPVFYKFPFHLFKREKWNVEHIDSNTSNDLTDEKQQKEWLLAAWIVVSETTKKEIENFLINKNGEFDDIYGRVVKQISSNENRLDESERMRIWNLALLDETTNKGYHNDIFPLKRRCLIGKDQGKIIDSIIEKEKDDDSLKIKMTSKDADISFIPICTKNAFTKYYTPITNNLMDWDKTDAESYRQNIIKTLEEFGIKNSSNNQNEEKNEQ